MKYTKIHSLDLDYWHYLGLNGLYGIVYGHELTKQQRAKAKYIWTRLCRLYGYID